MPLEMYRPRRLLALDDKSLDVAFGSKDDLGQLSGCLIVSYVPEADYVGAGSDCKICWSTVTTETGKVCEACW